ncbi:MAG: bifunctional glutamate N-acetyltransferase/amino-acid acetyltransferase ArgJ [Planctomycetota bacterium]
MSPSQPSSRPPKRCLTVPKGFLAAGGTCGIKPSGKPDLAVIAAETPCVAAGVFTRNRLPGEAVRIGRRHLARARRTGAGVRGIVCNSGNANVATGRREAEDCLAMCRATAEALGCDSRQVLPASTGVIGQPLPIEKIVDGVGRIARGLAKGAKADHAAAQAILTTDTRPKTALRRFELSGTKVVLAGVTKGAAMIAPNMATTLCFVTCDARVDAALWQAALGEAVAGSYNRMSIDGDQSTSDTIYALASGAAGGRSLSSRTSPVYRVLRDALVGLLSDLAEQIVRDAEGFGKLIRVNVTGAKSSRDADRVGRAVVNSPLVKCAVAGGDPNWGRLVMAVGNSGAAVRASALRMRIGGVDVYAQGQPTHLTSSASARLVHKMQANEVPIDIALGLGQASAEWVGCDLTAEYLRLNTEYTT